MSNLKEVRVPDLGSVAAAEIIEIPVKVGDTVQPEDALITLESDKASMDVPAPFGGTVAEILVKVGDKVSKSDLIMHFAEEAGAQATATSTQADASAATTEPVQKTSTSISHSDTVKSSAQTLHGASHLNLDQEEEVGDQHAGPGVRRLAREFGIHLASIRGTGQKGRIIKEDLQNYVKSSLSSSSRGSEGDFHAPKQPDIDFKSFGEVETKPLSRIKKLTAQNLHRNWLLVPHVTQFNEADITELEAFRKAQANFAIQSGIKLTPLAFIMKAVVTTLKAFPSFNASLSADGQQLIIKKYFHFGIAVDTPEGLVVPVIRDVDKKSLSELAKELGEISQKARAKQLTSADMQGNSFTISSLGGIGGTAFTPIVNVPDVAILGVSKAQYKPQYQGSEFVPRLMLPLSLSYDHRVIDGAEGARFIVYLADCLADIRRWLL